MAGITLAQAESQLSKWLTASETLATGKEVEIDGQRLRLEDVYGATLI
jgi:hypothetical protein